MRVITGTAKGRRIKTVPGSSTRPISDRVKVALFDIINPDVEGSIWLDLFAGTGGVGIEALSRGAKRVAFIDSETLAIQTIQENLSVTNLEAHAQVIRSDSFEFLKRKNHEQFDVIYVAPPQYHGHWLRVMEILDNNPDWISEDGQIIIQIDPREYLNREFQNFQEYDRRKYGSTLLVFYEKPGE